MTNDFFMRILFALTYYTPHWTGLTEHARRLAEALATNHAVTIVATQHEKNLPIHEIQNQVEFIVLQFGFVFPYAHFSSIFSHCLAGMKNSDVVIVYTPLAEVLFLAVFARVLQKKIILIHNGDLILPKGIGNRVS